MIAVNDVCYTVGNQALLNNLNFSLSENKITALLGANGAGKTTTLHVLAGLLSPTAGTVHVEGYGGNQDVRSVIGFLPQYPKFPEWLTVIEVVGFAAEFAGEPKHAATQKAEITLQEVGLADAIHKKVSQLSGGMKQRLGVAQAIVHLPRLLMLDEPMSALDPEGRRDMQRLLVELSESTTIVYSTHILHDAEQIANDVLMIHRGEIALHDSLETVLKSHSSGDLVIEAKSPLDRWEDYMRLYHPDVQIETVGKRAVVRGQMQQTVLFQSLLDEEVVIEKMYEARPTLDEFFDRVVNR
ncbi:ABC transporter ATP-binding protein [Geomicrobium sp. JSM 1781026]|uniref:ABC transporter ATP-binding protein n=1 Tax=Geomicrobium sp. JSM 1781026 TaxID=3344580 RepID=UPI0035C0AACF